MTLKNAFRRNLFEGKFGYTEHKLHLAKMRSKQGSPETKCNSN
jgi:hypothetical protein